MFGSLFGVRNYIGFEPIAPERGLPSDMSHELVEWGEVPENVALLLPSWISWEDLKGADWDERGEIVNPGYSGPGATQPPRRRDVQSQGWKTLLDIMKVLARQFGDEGVRMLVWFE